MRFRSVAATLLVGVAACLTTAAAPAAPPPVRPKLIVAISVDQFSSELYRRYLPSYTGGLQTLSGGVAYPIGYQSHAATETCPGHSTILTGRHPAATGIVANTWFDAKTGSTTYCVQAPGSSDPNARGPQNLRVSTLGDWVKAAEPGARSYAVSGKDRAAITMAGHHADGVYWWVDGEGFTTSPFAGPAGAAVTAPAAAFNRATFAAWTANKPALWPQPSEACRTMEKPVHFGQIDLSGHVPPDLAVASEDGPAFLQTTNFQENLRASPLFDRTVVQFAERLIADHHLGHGPATDVLAVSLSANDYVGHRYGNGGPEMCVQQAALDATLGGFVADLQALGVPVMVVLTADHGATDAAEREQATVPGAARLDGGAFVGRLNKALEQQLGLTYEPVVGDNSQQLYVNVGPDPQLRARVRAAAVAWLKQQPQVRAVFTRDEVAAATIPAGTTADRLTVAQRFHESYDPERSGDIAVEFAERTSFGVPRGPGDVVAGHGSPWDHDRQVPILFWWPGAAPETRPTPAETVDIAPTLAALARVPTPPVDGRCLVLGGATCDASPASRAK